MIVLHGSIQVNGGTAAGEADLVVLSQSERNFSVMANSDASVLLLSGEPIDEPVVGYGPFVMNSEEEIAVAIEDFNSGQFGNIN